MEKELAFIVVMSSLRAAHELAGLFPPFAAHGDVMDEPVKVALGSAIYDAMQVAFECFKEHPELQGACEARLEKYGPDGA